jgi:hypothetical protein
VPTLIDEHTRDWYAVEMGMSEADFAPMPPPAGPPPVPRLAPPPHTSGEAVQVFSRD